jgi:hypothetical protein
MEAVKIVTLLLAPRTHRSRVTRTRCKVGLHAQHPYGSRIDQSHKTWKPQVTNELCTVFFFMACTTRVRRLVHTKMKKQKRHGGSKINMSQSQTVYILVERDRDTCMSKLIMAFTTEQEADKVCSDKIEQQEAIHGKHHAIEYDVVEIPLYNQRKKAIEDRMKLNLEEMCIEKERRATRCEYKKRDQEIRKRYPTVYMNRAIDQIGISRIIDGFRDCLEKQTGQDIAIVSIGSGNGGLEWILENEIDLIQGRKIICVDPVPLSFSEEPLCIAPTYATAQDLVNQRPDLVSNCTLLLNWCPPNESTFDYDAIQLLKPLAFYTIMERYMGLNGAAGGSAFHELLHQTESPYKLQHEYHCSWDSWNSRDIGGLIIAGWYRRSVDE